MRQRNDGQNGLFTSRDKAFPHLGQTHDLPSPDKINSMLPSSVHERDSRLISDDLPNLQEIFQKKMK